MQVQSARYYHANRSFPAAGKRFRFKERLYDSKISLIYRAETRKGAHPLVVKTLNPQGKYFADYGQPYLTELLRYEGNAMLELCDASAPPSLAKYYGRGKMGCADGAGKTYQLPYLAMEYIEGHSLYEAIYGASPYLPAQFNTAISYARHIARGLGYIHGQGRVQADVKPENIIIGSKQRDPQDYRFWHGQGKRSMHFW
jgi:serine/threonine protein kinase